MAFYNGVYETSTTVGTGTYTLDGAFVAAGALGTAYQDFSIVGNGSTCYYRAQDNENGGWEEGIGTYTASGTTLARTRIIASGNANAAVSWVTGTRQVFLVQSAEGFIQLGSSTYGSAFWTGAATQLGTELYRPTGGALRVTYEFYIESYSADILNSEINGIIMQVGTQGVGAANNAQAVYGISSFAQSTLPSPRTAAVVVGGNFQCFASGGGTVTTGRGIYTQINCATSATYTNAYAIDAWVYKTTNTAGVGTSYGYSLTHRPGLAGLNHFCFWSDDITTTPVATNPYFLWFDSPGVFRVKGDGVLAYYNPSFTKYTPGATAFERTVIQWNGNVAEIGTEKGTTGGTLRPLHLIGAGIQIDSSYGVITPDADASTITINWTTSNWHSTTLTASRTIAFTGDVDGGAITIIFKSDGSGQWTPVWPAGVKWLNGTAPILTNASGHWDLVSIKRESSGNYIGTYSPNYF